MSVILALVQLIFTIGLGACVAIAVRGWRRQITLTRQQLALTAEVMAERDRCFAAWTEANDLNAKLLALSSSPYRNPAVHEFVQADGVPGRCICSGTEDDVLHVATLQRIAAKVEQEVSA